MPTEQPEKNAQKAPVAPDVERKDKTADKDQDKDKTATRIETDLELADDFQATDN